MFGVPRQHIGTQQQKPDCPVCAITRQGGEIFTNPALHARMIKPGFWIFDRRRDRKFWLAFGITLHQQRDHIREIIRRSRKPILQCQEIGPQILCGARDEAQQLRQFAQHFHLPLAAGAATFLLAAQPLQQAHQALGFGGHIKPAHPCHARDLRGRKAAHQRITIEPPRRDRTLHQFEVIFQKQHAGDDDIRACNIRMAGGQRRFIARKFIRRV